MSVRGCESHLCLVVRPYGLGEDDSDGNDVDGVDGVDMCNIGGF